MSFNLDITPVSIADFIIRKIERSIQFDDINNSYIIGNDSSLFV